MAQRVPNILSYDGVPIFSSKMAQNYFLQLTISICMLQIQNIHERTVEKFLPVLKSQYEASAKDAEQYWKDNLQSYLGDIHCKQGC